MNHDPAKIEEVVLALLGASEVDNGRAWKGYDFDVMDALHEKGYITNPRSRSKSIQLTEDGLALARKLADRYFGQRD